MVASINPRRSPPKGAYYLWVGVFVAIVLGGAFALYYAAVKIDYVWRWYRIPRYFAYQEQVEVQARIEGEVASITPGDKATAIRVKGPDGEETYRAPQGAEVRVYPDDFISPGDPLAVYPRWRVGILLQGLWITLKVSLLAIAFGVIIGLFGGLARISANPALKWLSITYIELIRGSPLLVQIFIWYFVLGTLINTMLQRHGLVLRARFRLMGGMLQRLRLVRAGGPVGQG